MRGRRGGFQRLHFFRFERTTLFDVCYWKLNAICSDRINASALPNVSTHKIHPLVSPFRVTNATFGRETRHRPTRWTLWPRVPASNTLSQRSLWFFASICPAERLLQWPDLRRRLYLPQKIHFSRFDDRQLPYFSNSGCNSSSVVVYGRFLTNIRPDSATLSSKFRLSSCSFHLAFVEKLFSPAFISCLLFDGQINIRLPSVDEIMHKIR